MSILESQCLGVGWSIFLSIVIFILGFMTKRFFVNQSADRSEDRSLISYISVLVGDLRTKAFVYYSLSAVDVEAIRISAEIRSLIRQIAGQVQLFSNHYPNKMGLRSCVVKLRQAVTLQLDDSSRMALPSSSPILGDIDDKCRILIGELDILCCNRYREVKKGYDF